MSSMDKLLRAVLNSKQNDARFVLFAILNSMFESVRHPHKCKVHVLAPPLQ